MPTYGYRCSNCGHEFEILQKITDAPLKACPKCQGKLSKKLYPVGISFKGSGFYTTDYKSSGEGADASSSNGALKGSGGGGSEGASGKKSETKSQTKSESKSEPKSEKKSEPKSDSKTEKKST